MKHSSICIALLTILIACEQQNTVEKRDVPLLSVATPPRINVLPAENQCPFDTVRIGTQVWMKQNLQTARFANGDLIPQFTDGDSLHFAEMTTPAWCYFNNDSSNNCTYGKLYNWYAVVDSRNVCPVGWHVPSDAEFTTMVDYAGGFSHSAPAFMEVGAWADDSPYVVPTNTTGFSGRPGGYRYENGSFRFQGLIGQFWTSSIMPENSDYAISHYLDYGTDIFVWGGDHKTRAVSVRCIKD